MNETAKTKMVTVAVPLPVDAVARLNRLRVADPDKVQSLAAVIREMVVRELARGK